MLRFEVKKQDWYVNGRDFLYINVSYVFVTLADTKYRDNFLQMNLPTIYVYL